MLMLELNAPGEVLDVEITDSKLPGFDDFVLDEVRHGRFTPPTREGRPVNAKARRPLPIRIGQGAGIGGFGSGMG